MKGEVITNQDTFVTQTILSIHAHRFNVVSTKYLYDQINLSDTSLQYFSRTCKSCTNYFRLYKALPPTMIMHKDFYFAISVCIQWLHWVMIIISKLTLDIIETDIYISDFRYKFHRWPGKSKNLENITITKLTYSRLYQALATAMVKS